jgi:DNA-binding LacI/PurR family transcriptional regulator
MSIASIATAGSYPLYIQIAERIREQIRSGNLAVGAKLANELDIAVELQVARGTVRQALDVLVKEGLLARQSGKGTFVIGQVAEACLKRIGVVVPFLRDSLTVDILSGLEYELRQNNYSLVYGSSDGDVDIECEQILRLQRDQVCGLVLMPVSTNSESMQLSQVLPKELHTILLDREIPGYQSHSVFSDNQDGARQAVNHLLALGHRRIVCITHKGYVSSTSERVRGFEDAMRAAGMMPLAAIPIEWHGPTHEGLPPCFLPEEMEALIPLLDSPKRPTAMFCVNDFTAYGVMQYLLGRGIRVPGEISLIGFDDIALAPFMPVPLTTVSQPKYEIGRRAAQTLLQIISLNEPGRLVQVRLPTTLIVRASTGPI